MTQVKPVLENCLVLAPIFAKGGWKSRDGIEKRQKNDLTAEENTLQQKS